MSKDPTPKADGLRAMREATRGHLQAKAEPRKLIPYAGKAPGSREDRCGNKPPNTKPPRARRKYKRKTS